MYVRPGEPKAFRPAAGCALFALALALRGSPSMPLVREHTLRVPCTVTSVSLSLGSSSSYQCDTDGGIRLAVAGIESPSVGERVLLRGRLAPFDVPRNPGEPDEREIARERGLDARLSGANVLAILPARPPSVHVRIALAQAWALAQLHARIAEPYATILAGEMWGAKGALPPELRAEFQETGTVHVLVTAGLHLGVVAMVLLGLFRACTLPRTWCAALTMLAVWCYAAFTGLHIPSFRAAVMVSLGLCAFALGRRAGSWRAFLLALAAMLVFEPQSVRGASFALSFSCVGAILLFAKPIASALEQTALPKRLVEALSLTVATQIGTWPLIAATFLIFAPYAIVANVCVVPVVGCTMILGALQLALAAIPLAAQEVANVNGWLLAWIVAVVHTVASLPGASIAMTPAPPWCIALYDAALAGAAWCMRRGARTLAATLALIGVLLVIAPPLAPENTLRITVLDVGQADGIVIQTPRGGVILVDAGGRLESRSDPQSNAEAIGERIVVPFLRRAGVRRIEAIVLSHPHGDHAGGVAPVLRAFPVTEFADGGQRYSGFAYNDALQTARAERVPIVYPRAGARWRTDDGVTFTFVGPSLPFIAGGSNDINDNSIAFILQYRAFRMLFTGDAGTAAEQRFLREGLDLRATILKVGHHGSAYGSTPAFIAAVHPAYAIVSVGRHNMFGHPAPSTIQTLQRFGARVYRTDQNGAVTVVTNGTAVRVQAFVTAPSE